MQPPPYRGRFAPSPTGPLHFGSLVTALASYLEARCHHGAWLVRIEDLDPLRESREAVDRILKSLEAHRLHSDETIRYQSERGDSYRAAVERLLANGRAYPCACSRKDLQARQGRHTDACRARRPIPPGIPYAVRFALKDAVASWDDQLLGIQTLHVRANIDDPVILRKEGFFAYQLAVVLDDIDQGINHIVRGSDLLDTTGQQQQVYQAFNAECPHWLHIPVILNEAGQKLSKQTHAPALDDSRPADNLVRALAALGQCPPAELATATPETVLAWGQDHWQRQRIPRQPHREGEAPPTGNGH